MVANILLVQLDVQIMIMIFQTLFWPVNKPVNCQITDAINSMQEFGYSTVYNKVYLYAHIITKLSYIQGHSHIVLFFTKYFKE